MRKLQAVIPTLSALGLPPIFDEIAKEKTGLVLVTGATGSGKTTTLAALLNEINETQSVHVVTLEDPIEFVHPAARPPSISANSGTISIIIQMACAPRLRQAPKVILVGEMRDRATVEVALMAAETGHLVLSTLHTVDAGQSINRILGLFSLGEEQQLRMRLADSYALHRQPAPRAQSRRRPAAAHRNHGAQSAHARNDRAGRRREPQLLRNHRSELALRLDDVRPIDPERLRSGHDQRRNGAPLRLQERHESRAASILSRKRAGSTTSSTPACGSICPPTLFVRQEHEH